MVEAAVGAVQTRILLALRHETFFSLGAMNAAIRRELDRLNEAPMARGESRRALFEADERGHLQALRPDPWEWGEWVPRKVGPNCQDYASYCTSLSGWRASSGKRLRFESSRLGCLVGGGSGISIK